MKETQNQTPQYWRSFEQKNDTQAYQHFLEKEFPAGAEELSNPVTRRNFMKIMGSSAALAGLTACRMPKETIVPYVKSPEKLVPGKPKYYATSMNIGNHVQGLLVENHEGRPTNIQGNDRHTSSMGATSEFEQASILSLYDPERLKVVSNDGIPKTWAQFETYWRHLATELRSNAGASFAIITNHSPSITLAQLKKSFLEKHPKATWVSYESIDNQNIKDGLALLGHNNVLPYYHFDQANVALSLGHDFLGSDLDSVRHTRDFAKKRRVRSTKDKMNRLYTVESSYTLTGSNADHRIKLNPSEMEGFVLAIYNELSRTVSLPKIGGQENAHGHEKWIQALAKDISHHTGASIVSAGLGQTPKTHAMVHLINQALRNTGKTVQYTKTAEQGSAEELIAKIKEQKINTLLTLGCNPVYDLPSTSELATELKKVKNIIATSVENNETTTCAHWVLPQSHYLECWSDAKSETGQTNIVQPMIQPLFDTKSDIEIVHLLAHLAPKSSYDIVRQTWQNKNWKKTLHDGVAGKPSFASLRFSLKNSLTISKNTQQGIEIEFSPSTSTYDGRFANNGWLQEMPNPITKISWDNPAWVSPAFAKKRGLKNGQLIKLSKNNKTLELPIWIVPGQPNNTVTLELGYGRSVCGSIGKGTGYNTYRVRSSKDSYAEAGFSIAALPTVVKLANTQDHGSMEDRPLIREATLEEFQKHPEFAKEAVEHPPLNSLWEEHSYQTGYQWGMSIDLNTCTGCNACLIACQSENNVPIVGKEQVHLGREMHWIRMDRYFNGSEEDPMIVFQPVACAQCENAPCEQVCPVNATVHDDEGLNAMVYNRCIGTRYCSNNCPYKVRRFNFFNYIKESPIPTATSKLAQMSNNPDVTIRFRGVMEKCTYCTQRIEEVRSTAKLESRQIKDGEIKTACQTACPSEAIVFGNVNDPNSEVSQLKKLQQDYAMLAELNIKPRTTYLAKFRNPNPEIAPQAAANKHHGSH